MLEVMEVRGREGDVSRESLMRVSEMIRRPAGAAGLGNKTNTPLHHTEIISPSPASPSSSPYIYYIHLYTI